MILYTKFDKIFLLVWCERYSTKVFISNLSFYIISFYKFFLFEECSYHKPSSTCTICIFWEHYEIFPFPMMSSHNFCYHFPLPLQKLSACLPRLSPDWHLTVKHFRWMLSLSSLFPVSNVCVGVAIAVAVSVAVVTGGAATISGNSFFLYSRGQQQKTEPHV